MAGYVIGWLDGLDVWEMGGGKFNDVGLWLLGGKRLSED